MKLHSFLWFLVWGGMFTGIYALQGAGLFSSPMRLFQGARSLFPIIAAYLSLLWVLGNRSPFPFKKTPLAFLFYYSIIGIISSIFFSPNTTSSLYWAFVYLSPFLIMWIIFDQESALLKIQRLIQINYFVFFVLTASLLPQALGAGLGKIAHDEFYALPFNFGEIRSNGVGRYALVVSIVLVVRFFTTRARLRYLWLAMSLPSLFLLIQTQSRTALLGLSVVAALFIIVRGINWRFIFIGPVASYLVWLSGVKWRAQGEVSKMVFLSGREYTWQKGLAMIKQSPIFGWGFNADRLLLDAEHMHNSYLHSMIHGGIIGGMLFSAAIIGIWALILKSGILRTIRVSRAPEHAMLIESILIIGFLTSRSFFESTAAFYGVDQLLLIPAIAYIMLYISKSTLGSNLKKSPLHGSAIVSN